MSPALSQIVAAYAAFESQVRCWIAGLSGPACAVCEKVCCSPVYCRESLESPFLARVRAEDPPQGVYSPAKGWLTAAGCALACGRPPVCYQFNCRQITEIFPDDHRRYLMKVLSHLVPYVGRRAWGSRHIVEIMDEAVLARLKIARFQRRLAEARSALGIISRLDFSRPAGAPAALRAEFAKIVPQPGPWPDGQCSGRCENAPAGRGLRSG
jgi:hypothetical protein